MEKVSRGIAKFQLFTRTLLKRSLRVLIVIQLAISTFLLFVLPEPSCAAIPNAPSGLTATTLSLNQIRLDWIDNSSDETYFYIERKTGTGTYSSIGSVGANVITYTSSGLTPNTMYYFRIRAYNSSGYSAYSNEASATTLTVIAPSNLSVSSVTYTSATLIWTDNANNETGFSLERKTGSGNYTTIAYPAANATTYANTGLTPGTEYYYRIRAYNGSFYSDYSNELKVTTQAIPAPSGLAATPLSSTQIRLDWTDNSSDETYFYIERKTEGGAYSQIGYVGANIKTYTNTNLAQNTTYYYRVRAYNSSGYSAYSNEASATTMVLNAPSNLSVSNVTYTQATITWTDNSSEETSFYIERKTGAGGAYSQIGSVGANVTIFSNSGLTHGTEYYYRVRAYNYPNYSQYSNEVAVATPVFPAPSNLTATPLASNQMKLAWTDNATDESWYAIEYNAGSGYTNLANVGANTTTYTHSGLKQGTTYSYRVRAYNSTNGLYSEFSNEASAITPNLNAPSNLTVSSVSYSKAIIAWTDNSGDESGFKIERQSGAGVYMQVGSVGVNVTTYTDTGLAQGTQYHYRVRAYNTPNDSESSNEVAVATPVFPAPSNLTAAGLSSSQIRIYWTDNSSDETNFVIERKSGTLQFSQIAFLGANVTTYTNTGLAQNTTYSYRVRAYTAGSGAYSEFSNEASATTLTFNAPSDLSASPLSDKQIKLTWTDNSSDETQFSIEYRLASSQNYTFLTTVSTNISTYKHTNLIPNTKYYYRVRAYNGNEYSSYSNEADATTPSCVQEGVYQP